MSNSQTSTGNLVLDNPAASAVIFAIVVLCVFLGALYNVATSPHEGGGHGAPPAGAAHP